MHESEPNFLERFGAWLSDFGTDTEQLAALIDDESLPETTRQTLVGAVNYFFKSLDLIPDGIDDIGYLDDAFVLRVSAELAIRDDLSQVEADKLAQLRRLAAEAEVVQAFLGKDFPRLHDYVKALRKSPARGRAGADIVRDAGVRAAFLQDLRNFCRAYTAPRFTPEERTLVKLRAFCDAKLPK